MWVVTKNLYSYKTSQPVIHHLCGVVRFFLLLSSSSPHCIIYNCFDVSNDATCFPKIIRIPTYTESETYFVLWCANYTRKTKRSPLDSSKFKGTNNQTWCLTSNRIRLFVSFEYMTHMRRHHDNNFSLWPNNQMCNSHYILSSLKETRPVIYDLSCFNQIIILIYS